ncbi:hypothetical protein BTE56_03625 [Agrobacterium pusense]|nr:hypothetical protein BTE56_03625 [Agrobacterium pusense]
MREWHSDQRTSATGQAEGTGATGNVMIPVWLGRMRPALKYTTTDDILYATLDAEDDDGPRS